MTIEFEPRIDVLEPVCVVGIGDVALALANRVLRDLQDGHLSTLRGVVAGDALLLLGATDELPWVDGVQYLGRDPRAPTLLVPTQLVPRAPFEAFARAVALRAPLLKPPLAVLFSPPRIVSLFDAQQIVRAKLAAWTPGQS